MKTIKHFVKIYFTANRQSSGILSDKWVMDRHKLFLEGTYKSLMKQTFKGFEILLICGSWKKELTDKLTFPDNVKVVYDNGKKIMENLDTDFVAITRIDSDDLMHLEAMQEVEYQTREIVKSKLFKKAHMIFKDNLCWNKNKGNEFISFHKRPYPPFFTHVFPKSVYSNYNLLNSLHDLPHRIADQKADIYINLTDYKICVVKHGSNDSEVKEGRKPNIISDEKWERLLKEKRVITKDKNLMYKYLKDFGVCENEI